MKKNKPISLKFFISTYLLALILFFPALFNFYTHDDFFHYKIAQASSLKEFFAFFNFFHGPENWGYYRPLATQVLYFIGRTVFNFDPLAMHILAFLMFFIVIFLVFKLIVKLTQNQAVAYLGTLFYATSATHFSHLYSLANQELTHAIFFLSSVLSFISFLEKKLYKYLLFSLLFFILALTCKEFAAMLPLALILIYGLLKIKKEIKISLKELVLFLSPFGILLLAYLYLHIFHYGLVQGDSYIWVLTPKAFVNTVMWYGLWSLNLPKMLANFEFFGPGFQLNPEFIRAWSSEMTLVFSLFGGLLLFLISSLVLTFKKTDKKEVITYLFSLIWFVSILMPVLFLPWHKFTTYLTIPLIGVVIILGYLICKAREWLTIKKGRFIANVGVFLIFAVYISLSSVTLNLTQKSDWITQGAKVSRKVFDYFQKNYADIDKEITVIFYDTSADQNLKLRPSRELQLALSDNNFFAVFYPNKIKAKYVSSKPEIEDAEVVMISARQFFDW